jgi:tetratricopeptide (TPR) repeat protein
VLHSASASAVRVAKAQQAAATAVPAVTTSELTAEEWLERGIQSTDYEEKLLFCNHAIRLRPNYAEAFLIRGLARKEKGDLEGALRDFDQAVRIDPDYAALCRNLR